MLPTQVSDTPLELRFTIGAVSTHGCCFPPLLLFTSSTVLSQMCQVTNIIRLVYLFLSNQTSFDIFSSAVAFSLLQPPPVAREPSGGRRLWLSHYPPSCLQTGVTSYHAGILRLFSSLVWINHELKRTLEMFSQLRWREPERVSRTLIQLWCQTLWHNKLNIGIM